MPAATKRVCKSNEEDMELRRGPWTLEEDSMLIHYIACHGEGRWNMLAKCAGLKRTGKSCRLRWLNYLKPDIKRGNLTPHEQLLILDLHSKWGNRWSKIAQHLPGRTDNEIKNYWRTRVQKQARQLNIESNSKRFVDTVRCFWMPTLLQKMEQTASSPPTNSSLTSMNSQGSSAPSFGSSSSHPPRKLMPITLNHQHNENSSSSIHSSEYSMKISELQKMEQAVSSPPTNSSLTSMNSQGSSVGSSSSPPPRKLMPITLNHQHNENSSSSIHSSEYSMKISEESQVPEHPADPFHAFDNCSTVYNHPNLSDCHLVDSRSFDMEALILDPMSATDTYENSLLDCHMADGDWLSDNMVNSLWNMNEIMGSSHPYRSS